MGHPLEEVKDTPWGLRVDRDILDLKEYKKRAGARMSGLEASILTNTAITNSIKEDTQWLRDFINGTKAFGSLLLPLVLIVGGILAIVAAISGWFHGKG